MSLNHPGHFLRYKQGCVFKVTPVATLTSYVARVTQEPACFELRIKSKERTVTCRFRGRWQLLRQRKGQRRERSSCTKKTCYFSAKIKQTKKSHRQQQTLKSEDFTFLLHVDKQLL